MKIVNILINDFNNDDDLKLGNNRVSEDKFKMAVS